MKKKVKKASTADTSKSAITEKKSHAITTAKTDIADIFNAIQNKKSSAREEEPKTMCGRNGRGSSNSAGNGNKIAERSSDSDGLYRAPKKTLEVSDDVFFNAVSSRKGKAKGSKRDDSADDALLRREGVDRILSLAELQKLTSSNPKAGTTKNCPFDCNCCF